MNFADAFNWDAPCRIHYYHRIMAKNFEFSSLSTAKNGGPKTDFVDVLRSAFSRQLFSSQRTERQKIGAIK